jgi:hypothetical protein
MTDDALVAAVASQLLSKRTDIQIYDPSHLPLYLGNTSFDSAVVKQATQKVTLCDFTLNTDDTPTYAILMGLQYLRSLATSEVSKINSMTAKEKATWTNRLGALNAAIQQVDTLSSGLSANNSSTNQTAWTNIVRGEQVARLLAKNDTYIIELKVQSAGGETVVLDGAFFLAGASYRYSGGAIFTATLYKNSGQVLATKNFWGMTGDKKRKAFANMSH